METPGHLVADSKQCIRIGLCWLNLLDLRTAQKKTPFLYGLSFSS